MTRDEAVAFIISLLEEKGPLPGNVDPEIYDFVASGHIDSLAITKFLIRAEEGIGARIADEDFEGDAFHTVGGLVDLLLQRGGDAA